MRTMPETNPTLLITGAGSGMGQECALYLAARGYRVFGTVLHSVERNELCQEASQRGVSLTAVPMDVTKPEDVQSTVDSVLSQAGSIDGVIQFAGIGLRGFFEDLTLDEVRRVFEVNVFGAMAVAQAVLPHMRKNRRGRLIFVSSAAGRMGTMSISGYASSKFALEGLAECLAQEVRPFDIWVSLLEPGLIWTPHFTVNRNRARRATDPASPYYLWFCQHEKLVDDILARRRFTAADAARVVHGILRARHPRLRYVVGPGAKLVFKLRSLLPGEWFEQAYWGVVRRKVTRPREQATRLS
jgi:NAD(P)-dependent dehydrogenase (short-subunit alcohol dehydrogenase family)